MSASMQVSVEQPPVWHANGAGRSRGAGLSRDAFHFLDQHVNSTSVTLETGAGLSTVLFAMKGSKHSCVAHEQGEVDRIKEHCLQNQISTERITFHIAPPEEALQQAQGLDLDLALIDGHRAFLEWSLVASRLKVGGLLLIGDTQVWTGCVLRDFLLGEPHWKHFANLSETTAFMKMRGDIQPKVSASQPHIVPKIGRIESATAGAEQAVAAPRNGAARRAAPPGVLAFQCNICRHRNAASVGDLGPSCLRCGSTVRFRSIVRVLAMELLGENIALPDFPARRDISGLGLSDWKGYALPLAQKLNYTNTFFHYTREARLDITDIDPVLEGGFDFVIASEIFEYVNPPVSVAFENARRLLKPDGVLLLTTPYRKRGAMTEHYPDLFSYKVITEGDRPILRNLTREGVEQVFDRPVLRGAARNLEMRVFSESALLQHLKDAGFTRVKVHSEPDFVHGVYWAQDHSLPISARP
jgi:SAM-dependent methyltransferase